MVVHTIVPSLRYILIFPCKSMSTRYSNDYKSWKILHRWNTQHTLRNERRYIIFAGKPLGRNQKALQVDMEIISKWNIKKYA
jgi:hypothetical protein